MKKSTMSSTNLICIPNEIYALGLYKIISDKFKTSIIIVSRLSEVETLLQEIEIKNIFVSASLINSNTFPIFKRINTVRPSIKLILVYESKTEIYKKVSQINTFALSSNCSIKLCIDTLSNFEEKEYNILNNTIHSSNMITNKKYLDRLYKDILYLITHELTMNEIASALHLSIKTIEYHKKYLSKKISARNMIGLAKYAIKNNIDHDPALILKFKNVIKKFKNIIR